MASSLDFDVVADCVPDDSCCDTEESQHEQKLTDFYHSQPKLDIKALGMGIVPRVRQDYVASHNTNLALKKNWTPSERLSAGFAQEEAQTVFNDTKFTSQKPNPVGATRNISDEMIEDGAYVVFDWDNTLKLYDRGTRQLSSRVSREFLLHLKYDRGCRLFIISAIQPSAVNLSTLLFEVEKLGLTDVFVNDNRDQVDGVPADKPVVKSNEYAYMGNVIICGYDKAETFLRLSSFNSARGEKVVFFDDELVNIDNFSAIVPNSVCYLCE